MITIPIRRIKARVYRVDSERSVSTKNITNEYTIDEQTISINLHCKIEDTIFPNSDIFSLFLTICLTLDKSNPNSLTI